MRRRTLLLAGAASAVPSWAGAQCVTGTVAVDACRGGVYGGAPPSLDLDFTAGTLDPRITFTRAAGPATYFDAAGVLQTAGTNVARFDFDPVTHAQRGLLIEEVRTNLLLNSAAPGTQSVAVTAQAYTLSFYGTGTITKSGTATGALVGTGAFPTRVTQTFTPTAGTLTLTVTGSVLNANIEAGSFATSWITTTGASATRAADVATMPMAGIVTSPAAGTLVADAAVANINTPSIQFAAQLDDGSSANRAIVRQNTTVANMLIVSGGVVQTNLTAGTTAVGIPFKAGLSWTAGQQLVATNGVAGVSGSGALSPAAITTMRLGINEASLLPLNGWISRVRYWPRALSASELQVATT